MSKVICTDYRPDPYESRQGFAYFYLPKMKMKINHCPVFMKNGKRWISMPSWKDFKNDGKYYSCVEFDKPVQTKFVELALKALDTYCIEGGENSVFNQEGQIDFKGMEK